MSAYHTYRRGVCAPGHRIGRTCDCPGIQAGEPHRPQPNPAKTHCLVCLRRIRKGTRRPSGLYWRHVA